MRAWLENVLILLCLSLATALVVAAAAFVLLRPMRVLGAPAPFAKPAPAPTTAELIEGEWTLWVGAIPGKVRFTCYGWGGPANASGGVNYTYCGCMEWAGSYRFDGETMHVTLWPQFWLPDGEAMEWVVTFPGGSTRGKMPDGSVFRLDPPGELRPPTTLCGATGCTCGCQSGEPCRCASGNKPVK